MLQSSGGGGDSADGDSADGDSAGGGGGGGGGSVVRAAAAVDTSTPESRAKWLASSGIEVKWKSNVAQNVGFYTKKGRCQIGGGRREMRKKGPWMQKAEQKKVLYELLVRPCALDRYARGS